MKLSRLITHVETTQASIEDDQVLETVHHGLADLLHSATSPTLMTPGANSNIACANEVHDLLSCESTIYSGEVSNAAPYLHSKELRGQQHGV